MDYQTYEFIKGIVEDYYESEIGNAFVNGKKEQCQEYNDEKKDTIKQLKNLYAFYQDNMSKM